MPQVGNLHIAITATAEQFHKMLGDVDQRAKSLGGTLTTTGGVATGFAGQTTIAATTVGALSAGVKS